MIIILAIIISFLLIPLIAVNEEKIMLKPENNGTSSLDEETTEESKIVKFDVVNLYLGEEKQIVKLEISEYIVGVVAAEMPAENNIEALKAQAIASYTYAYRKHLQNKQTNNEYDLTDDSKLDQRYINKEERKTKWGSNYEEFENKIKSAVDAVKNQLIVYNNEPILAAYHSISPGKTETAKNVWGSDYPYLQSENSVGDLLCPEFYSEVVVTKEEFIKKLTELGATPGENINEFIGENNKSEAGMVMSIELCGKVFSGVEIREAFELKAAAFDLSLKDENFVFSVSGYGHGVGMSQYGANYMAQQGSDYKEIITSYYRGCEIVDIK